MALLISVFILISIVVVLLSLSACVTSYEKAKTGNHVNHKNYDMWLYHGAVLTLIIMFVIIVWLVFANITIAYILFNYNDWLYAFLNVFFIVIATFLSFFTIFRELKID